MPALTEQLLTGGVRVLTVHEPQIRSNLSAAFVSFREEFWASAALAAPGELVLLVLSESDSAYY